MGCHTQLGDLISSQKTQSSLSIGRTPQEFCPGPQPGNISTMRQETALGEARLFEARSPRTGDCVSLGANPWSVQGSSSGEAGDAEPQGRRPPGSPVPSGWPVPSRHHGAECLSPRQTPSRTQAGRADFPSRALGVPSTCWCPADHCRAGRIVGRRQVAGAC